MAQDLLLPSRSAERRHIIQPPEPVRQTHADDIHQIQDLLGRRYVAVSEPVHEHQSGLHSLHQKRLVPPNPSWVGTASCLEDSTRQASTSKVTICPGCMAAIWTEMARSTTAPSATRSAGSAEVKCPAPGAPLTGSPRVTGPAAAGPSTPLAACIPTVPLISSPGVPDRNRPGTHPQGTQDHKDLHALSFAPAPTATSWSADSAPLSQ